MTDILAKICADKRVHIADCKARVSEAQLREKIAAQSKPRGFKKELFKKILEEKPSLIAEIKKASPSRGLIRADFDPVALAQAYERGGATCLSVLTDTPYFQGADEYLVAAREAVKLPVLRKDFMLDSYQIMESRALGADCVLLIMAALSDEQASELELAASELGMDVLVEVHDSRELERATKINPNNIGKIFGVNNRDLKSLEVSLTVSESLVRYIPKDAIRICESGIANNSDIVLMQTVGFDGFLVGESLMRQADIEQATRELLGI